MVTVATDCPGGRGPVRSIARTVVADSSITSLGLNLDAHNLTTAGSPLAKFRPVGFNAGEAGMPFILESLRALADLTWLRVATLLLAFVARAAASANVPTESEMVSLLPEDVRPSTRWVPSERNAYSNWVFATSNWVRVSSGLRTPLRQFGDVNQPITNTAAHIQAISNLVTANLPALKAFGAGIRQGQLQPASRTNRDYTGLARDMFDLRLAQNWFLLLNGQTSEVCSNLCDNLAAGRMLLEQSDSVSQLLAVTLNTIACVQIQSLIQQPAVSSFDLSKLADALDRESLAGSAMVEAIKEWSLVSLLELKQKIDRMTSTDESAEMVLEMPISELISDAMPLLADPGLIARHPQPIDYSATAAEYAGLARRHIAAWTSNDTNGLSGLHSTAVANRLMQDAAPLLEKGKNVETPLSAEDAERLAPLHRAISNPVGRMALSFDWDEIFALTMRRFQRAETIRKITRIAIELELHRRLVGKLPRRLDELPVVAARPDLAVDSQTKTPFAYSSQAGRLWSLESEGDFPHRPAEVRTNHFRGLAWPTLPPPKP